MVDDERDFATPEDISTIVRCVDGEGIKPSISAN
jgi:hypothetical protein